MKIEEAVEFLQKELIESSYFNPIQRAKLNDIIILLKNKQELAQNFQGSAMNIKKN